MFLDFGDLLGDIFCAADAFEGIGFHFWEDIGEVNEGEGVERDEEDNGNNDGKFCGDFCEGMKFFLGTNEFVPECGEEDDGGEP